jgi:hypothetical protein
VDGCSDCVLYDAAYTIAEPPDSQRGGATVSGSEWQAVDSVTDAKGKSFHGQYHQKTFNPQTDRIRIYNTVGNAGVGFYGEVYGPPTEENG